MKSRILVSLLSLIFLFACSKDDNPSPSEATNGNLQGVFIDSPVEGLKYKTETHSGFTDENGTYKYEEGETVTFYVGDIELGSAKATGQLSPIDIAITPNANIETLEVQNIAAFLQTLDEDGDPENGIIIDREVAEAISFSEIDFTKNSIQIFGEIALEVFQATGKSLNVVFPENAAIHLAETLNLEYEPSPSLAHNFLPTFTNYYTFENKAVNWVHEFDGEGSLRKSTKYENYPLRIKEEFLFSYDDSGRDDIKVESNLYKYHSISNFRDTFFINIDDNYFIDNINKYGEDGNLKSSSEFRELTEQGWVSEIKYISFRSDDSQTTYSIKYDYTEKGFAKEVKNFNSSGELTRKKIQSATDFGEIEKSISEYSNTTSTAIYTYRDNNTLKVVEFNDFSPNSYVINLKRVYELDENESYAKFTVTIETTSDTSRQIDIFDKGILLKSTSYIDGQIDNIEYYEPRDDGTSYKSRVEEYDQHGNLFTIQYWNESGELEYTEFYDDDGNLTDTVYE